MDEIRQAKHQNRCKNDEDTETRRIRTMLQKNSDDEVEVDNDNDNDDVNDVNGTQEKQWREQEIECVCKT